MRSFLFAVLGALAIGSASAQVKPAKANHDKKHAPAPPPPKHHSPAPSPSHTGGSGRGLNINIPKGRVHQFDTDGNLIDISNDQIEYLGGRYQWSASLLLKRVSRS